MSDEFAADDGLDLPDVEPEIKSNEIEDAFKGSLFSYELNTEYRLFKHFSIGAGIARLGIDADIDDDDWNGTVNDSYRGFTAFGKFYF